MQARVRNKLNGAVVLLFAVALMAIGFGHSMTRVDLDPDRAFAIAIGGGDALCDPGQNPGASGNACAACVLTKSLSLPDTTLRGGQDVFASRAVDMPVPRRSALRSVARRAAGGIRAPPRA